MSKVWDGVLPEVSSGCVSEVPVGCSDQRSDGRNLDALAFLVWNAHGFMALGAEVLVEDRRAPGTRSVLAQVELGPVARAEDWRLFRQGYRDFGGNPEWEDRFVDVIDTCESEGHGWADTYPLYISRAQFHPGSWATAVGVTKLTDPSDPYHVGAAVAAWSELISHPGGTGGWAAFW